MAIAGAIAKPCSMLVVVTAIIVITGVIIGSALGWNYRHPNVTSNVAYADRKCSVPDAFCNITVPAVGTCTVCPFQTSSTDRVTECATFNFTNCPRLGTYLSFRFQIDLSTLGIIPDNVTAAALVLFPQAVRAAIPGATTTLRNASFSSQGLFGDVVSTSLSNNMTTLQAETALSYLQWASYLSYSGLPVTLTSWNSTSTSLLPTPGANVCLNTTCPVGQTCMSWINYPVCICNFPQTVRSPFSSTACVTNPCYPANGACPQAQPCVPNFNAYLNRTCVGG